MPPIVDVFAIAPERAACHNGTRIAILPARASGTVSAASIRVAPARTSLNRFTRAAFAPGVSVCEIGNCR
jgi:hypothetical protein